MYLFSVLSTVHSKVANSNTTNYIFLRSAINTLSIEHIKVNLSKISKLGWNAYLKKILESVDEVLVNPQPLSEDNTATLRDLHDQILCKHELITTKILEATKEDGTIEAKILQAEETNAVISRAKAKIIHHLSSITARDTTTSPRAPPPSRSSNYYYQST